MVLNGYNQAFNAKKADSEHSKHPESYFSFMKSKNSSTIAGGVEPKKRTLMQSMSFSNIDKTTADLDELVEDDIMTDGRNSIFYIAVATTVFYMGSGVLIFMHMLDWTFIDSFYFVTVTLTTVGYGDINGHGDMTQGSILFTSFYVLVGILLMGSALGIIAAALLERQEIALKAALSAALTEESKLAGGGTRSVPSKSFASVIHAAEDAEKWLSTKYTQCTSYTCRQLVPSFMVLTFMLGLGVILIHFDDESLTFIECFYFSVVTSTTIGYGDISPATPMGRLFGALYLLVTVTATGNVLGNIAGQIIEKKQREAMEMILHKRITIKDFEKFDLDGDGRIEKSEFVIQKLILMGLLNPEDISRVETEFNTMDEDGSGEITLEDLNIYLAHKEKQKVLLRASAKQKSSKTGWKERRAAPAKQAATADDSDNNI